MLGVLLAAALATTPTPTPSPRISLKFVVYRETARGIYYRSVIETQKHGKGLKTEMGPKPNTSACDRFTEKIEHELGVRVPCFNYYMLKSVEHVAIATKLNADGVARLDSNSIYSIYDCHQHEIVHLAVHQLGNPDAVFHEGIATMLGNAIPNVNRGYVVDRFMKKKMSYDQFRGLFSDPGQDRSVTGQAYGVADEWMRHLRDRYGMSRMVEFLRTTKDSGTKEAFCDMAGMTPAESFHLWLYGKKVLVMP